MFDGWRGACILAERTLNALRSAVNSSTVAVAAATGPRCTTTMAAVMSADVVSAGHSSPALERYWAISSVAFHGSLAIRSQNRFVPYLCQEGQYWYQRRSGMAGGGMAGRRQMLMTVGCRIACVHLHLLHTTSSVQVLQLLCARSRWECMHHTHAHSPAGGNTAANNQHTCMHVHAVVAVYNCAHASDGHVIKAVNP